MQDNLAVNVSSLKLVEEELNSEIRQTGGHFEGFLLERSKVSHLEDCKKGIVQIRGTIKLLEVPGALQLTDEMLSLVIRLLEKPDAVNDHNLSVLSNAFVALPCYLEHTTARAYAMPVLVLPYINGLRAARFAELVPESQFVELDIETSAELPQRERQELSEDFTALVRRMRHMYHVGLLGVIKEDNIGAKIHLLQRAIDRLLKATGNQSLGELWWLTAALLEGFASNELELNLYRKRVLSSVDKYLKMVVYDGDEALSAEVPEALKRELLFLISLIENGGEVTQSVKAAYRCPVPPHSDLALVKERHVMQGPNAATVHSMVVVLKEELAIAKEVLEIAAQNIGEFIDFVPLTETLQKLADILVVVGVKTISNFIRDQIEKISGWQEHPDDVEQNDLLEMADALLYVESTLTGLDRLDLSEEDVREASELVKQNVIAKSHLAEAEMMVIHEAQAGISLAKRAISSFIESQFDAVHIANVATTLNSVRGGLIVLGLERAAAILGSCMRFVDNLTSDGSSDEAISELLETLADALISLEYYLSEVETHSNVDEKVLEVAEESLSSLGYPVDQVSGPAAE